VFARCTLSRAARSFRSKGVTEAVVRNVVLSCFPYQREQDVPIQQLSSSDIAHETPSAYGVGSRALE
jgi:hypothetical protein